MSFVNKFKNKILEDYNTKKTYYKIKILISLLVLPLIIVFLVDIISLIVGGSKDWFAFNPFFAFIILIIFRIILDGIVDLVFLSSGKIVDNMENLPENVGGQKTIVQYDLSKEVTPSEAAMILYGRSDLSNLISIIYGWVCKGIVKINKKHGKKYIESINKPGRSYSVYDNYLYNELFSKKEIVLMNKWILSKYKLEVDNLILLSCLNKGYIRESKNITSNKLTSKIIDYLSVFFLGFIGFFSLGYYGGGEIMNSILMLLFFCLFAWFSIKRKENENKKIKEKNHISILVLLFIVWPLCFIFFVVGQYFLLICSLIVILYAMNNRHKYYDIELTDKGKKFLSEIVGYKYYLERCEEEQINANLGNDEVYSKHLPYAIALKLNWKIIDELS